MNIKIVEVLRSLGMSLFWIALGFGGIAIDTFAKSKDGDVVITWPVKVVESNDRPAFDDAQYDRQMALEKKIRTDKKTSCSAQRTSVRMITLWPCCLWPLINYIVLRDM